MFGTIIALLDLFLVCASLGLDTAMINDFFSQKNVRTVHVYLCSKEDAQIFAKDLSLKTDLWFHVNYRGKIELNKYQNLRQGLFVDARCPFNRRAIQKSSDDGLMSGAFSWLIWNERMTDPFDYEELVLGMYSEVYVVTNGTVWGLYKTNEGSKLRVFKSGKIKGGIIDLSNGEKRKESFDGSVVNASYSDVFLTDPNTKLDLEKVANQLTNPGFDPNVAQSSKFFYAFHHLISEYFNYSIKLVPIFEWGEKLPNNSFTGILGQLQTEKTIFSMSALLLIRWRLEAAAASSLTLDFRIVLAFQQPRALGTPRAMILEFSSTVWICIGLSILVSGAVLYVIRLYSGELQEGESMLGAFLQVIRIYVNQGIGDKPKAASIEIFHVFLLLVSVVILSYYSAMAMTALLSPSPPKINSLAEFVKTSIPVCLLNGRYFFDNSARLKLIDPVLNDRIESGPIRFCHLDEGVREMLRGHAFVSEPFGMFDSVRRIFDEADLCSLAVMATKKGLMITSYTSHNPHIMEIFKRGAAKIWETGLRHREYNRWIFEPPQCSNAQKFIIIEMRAVSVAFGVYLGGLLSSLVLFLWELFTRERTGKAVILGKTRYKENFLISRPRPV